MSEIKSEINFLYQKLSEDSTEDDLYQTMHGFLNYLDKKGYYSFLSKHKIMEYAKAKKICNKVDKAMYMIYLKTPNSFKNQ